MGKPTSKSYSPCAYLLFVLLTVGCYGEANNQTDDGQTSTTQQNDPENDPVQQSTDTAQKLLGIWQVDAEATRNGWGDKREAMERRMVDEMNMRIEYRADQTVTITKNERSGDGMWQVKSKTGDAITIEAFGKPEADGTPSRKNEFTITFQEDDRILYQSAEVNGEDRLILTRVTQ